MPTTLPAADRLRTLTQLDVVYEPSISEADGRVLALGREGTTKVLVVVADDAGAFTPTHEQPAELEGEAVTLFRCPTDHANAAALREALPWTAPRVVGLEPSVGCGDRLGLATPGHARAVAKHGLVPIFAQQSIREMERTQRTPDEVMDAATWGVFEAGYRDGFGADADHLKNEEAIDRTAAAGFTFFTIDPSDHVDNDADDDAPDALAEKYRTLPWHTLETTPDALIERYVGPTFSAGDFELSFSEETLRRAAVKYSAAVAHTRRLYDYLQEVMDGRPFELEMSVDETETATSVEEHYFVAAELKRLGVEVVSLAPRFVGRMEKGVDYIGDRGAFEDALKKHVAIARALGPYKLSLHSGSDKFSIYGLFARHAGELFHLKTAGTSYLEALRAIARIRPQLFREILDFSRGRYKTDKATYHVSADLQKVPAGDTLEDDELEGLLDQFDARQVLHVTFGSVLTEEKPDGTPRYRDLIVQALEEDEDTHYDVLERHFDRHLEPFDAAD